MYKVLSLLLFLFLWSISISRSQSDLLLMQTHVEKKLAQAHPADKYIHNVDRSQWSFFKKVNPVRLSFAGLLTFYQQVLSRQLASGCMHYPTCARYARECIAHLGIFPGIALSADRLMRCNGFAYKENLLNTKELAPTFWDEAKSLDPKCIYDSPLLYFGFKQRQPFYPCLDY